MKSLEIGRMDRQITFKKESITTNEYNEKVVVWVDIDTDPTVWTSVLNMPGSEVLEANQLTAVQLTKFYPRYRNDLDVKMRIDFEGAVFAITSITEPFKYRKQLLEIKAELIAEE